MRRTSGSSGAHASREDGDEREDDGNEDYKILRFEAVHKPSQVGALVGLIETMAVILRATALAAYLWVALHQSRSWGHCRPVRVR